MADRPVPLLPQHSEGELFLTDLVVELENLMLKVNIVGIVIISLGVLENYMIVLEMVELLLLLEIIFVGI